MVYYSNRCPFSEYHVNTSLKETAEKRNLPLKIIKLDTLEKAQYAPTPATIFSLFLNGKFVTTDISVCMESRFDKIVKLNDLTTISLIFYIIVALISAVLFGENPFISFLERNINQKDKYGAKRGFPIHA